MPEFKLHAHREETIQVEDKNAIRFLGPDGPRVLSTPHMIGHMEGTCRNLILGMLDPGHDTVGTHVNVWHRAAAPMGSTVVFRAELLSVDGNKAEFKVSAHLGEKVVGEGTHQRTIINVKRFKEKATGQAA